jgi:N-acetyl-anhydromuramyl-L-alanine amidase AmpD
MPSPLNTFLNPANQVSAHYIICQSGQVIQCVSDEDTAYHAGIVNHPNWPLYDGTNPNRYTLGIEHEGFDGTLTEAQYQASLWLQKQLIAKFNLTVDTDHIIGHYRIDSVNRPNCPGPNFPWTRLLSDLKGGNTMQDINSPIESWEVPQIQLAVKNGIFSQIHQPREIFSASEIAAIMNNLLTRLGGK